MNGVIYKSATGIFVNMQIFHMTKILHILVEIFYIKAKYETLLFNL